MDRHWLSLALIALCVLALCCCGPTISAPGGATSASDTDRDPIDPAPGSDSNPDPVPGVGNNPDPGSGGGNNPDPGSGGGNNPDPGSGGGNNPDPGSGGGGTNVVPPSPFIPPRPTNRPRVFMALTGANELAKAANDGQWKYVRENLDGIFYNGAKVSDEEIAAMVRKIKTRVVIAPSHDPNGDLEAQRPVALQRQARYADIKFHLEAIALYLGAHTEWTADAMDRARASYVTVSSPFRFHALWAGWNATAFGNIAWADDPADIRVLVMKEAEGEFVEKNVTNSNMTSLRNAITLAHKRGQPFMWFTSVSDGRPLYGSPSISETFEGIKDLLTPDDVIMFINYGGSKPVVPEQQGNTYPDTLTGILNWALHQRL